MLEIVGLAFAAGMVVCGVCGLIGGMIKRDYTQMKAEQTAREERHPTSKGLGEGWSNDCQGVPEHVNLRGNNWMDDRDQAQMEANHHWGGNVPQSRR